MCVVSRGRPSVLSLLPHQTPVPGSQGRGTAPSLTVPMRPVGTIGRHRWLWGWQPNHLVAEGRPFPAPQAPKLCFGSRAPMDPTDLGHPNTQVPGNQGRWPLGLRAGVGGPPASRRPCCLAPGFPAQGAHHNLASAESPGSMEALSRMCQWSNLMFRQCPGSSRCHFSHLEIDSCGGKTDILRRCSPVRPNFFCSYKKIVHAYYRHSKLTRVEDVKAGGPWDSAGRDTSYVAEESRLTHGPCLVSRFRAVWSRWLADFGSWVAEALAVR